MYTSIKNNIIDTNIPKSIEGNIIKNFDNPNVSITKISDSVLSFWYVYTIAAKEIRGKRSANILGAIRLTNQKYEDRDKPLLIIKSIYFNDLDNQTTPVKTRLITKNGFNIFEKI